MPLIQGRSRCRAVPAPALGDESRATPSTDRRPGDSADDLFQVFTPHGADEIKFDPTYGGVDRRSLIVIRITMGPQTVAAKAELYRQIVQGFERLGIRRKTSRSPSCTTARAIGTRESYDEEDHDQLDRAAARSRDRGNGHDQRIAGSPALEAAEPTCTCSTAERMPGTETCPTRSSR
ncbi:MAG: tautomerase family protein [Galbitalea sp.]